MEPKQKKKIDQYEIEYEKQYHRDRFGRVYGGRNIKTKNQVAIKIVEKKNLELDEYTKEALFSELRIACLPKSKNLVEVYDIIQHEKLYYIVRENCEKNIPMIIEENRNKSIVEKQKQAKKILKQIAQGFSVLIRHGIIHQNLRPSVILYSKKYWKISDYLFSKKIFAKKIQETNQPKYYSAPQILKGLPINSKCDIWSLGCIYYELIHGYRVFDENIETDLQIYEASKEKQFKKCKPGISNQSQEFIEKCLEPDRQKRISWAELLLLKIFDGYFQKEKPFYCRLKRIMGDIRFSVNKQNLCIFKILQHMNYSNESDKLNVEEFERFLKYLYSQIAQDDINYIFENLNLTENKSISVNEIISLLEENSINLQSAFKQIPQFQNYYKISPTKWKQLVMRAEEHVRICFLNMYQKLQKKKKTLYDIFKEQSKSKRGRLTKSQFAKMMRLFDKDLEDDQINGIFELLSQKNTKTILYSKLNKYYSRINGIPESLSENHSDQEIETLQSVTDDQNSDNRKASLPNMFGFQGFKGSNQSFSNWIQKNKKL